MRPTSTWPGIHWWTPRGARAFLWCPSTGRAMAAVLRCRARSRSVGMPKYSRKRSPNSGAGISRTPPGIVLVGYSVGGAIALHLAAGDRTWPLLGVTVSGIHHESQRSNDALKSQPQSSFLEFSREHLLRFMYGPEDTYDPGVLDIAKHAESPVPILELVEVAGDRCTDCAGVAARVEVPVHYGLAEHEGFWHSSDESVAAFGKAFTAAPSVTARRILGGGHNVDHHYVGAAFHKEQLDFAKGLVTPAR